MSFLLVAAFVANSSIIIDYRPPAVGPWRDLAPLSSADDIGRVQESLNDILSDRWLEFPTARPETCDGPCATVTSGPHVSFGDRTHAPLDCDGLRQNVATARERFGVSREQGFALGAAFDSFRNDANAQTWAAVVGSYSAFSSSLNEARSAVPAEDLVAVLHVDALWQLKVATILPGMPGVWPSGGSGFTEVRRTGAILLDRPDFRVQTTSSGSDMTVKASLAVTPVEYCAGNVGFRLEGAATFLTATTSGTLNLDLPLTTSIALKLDPASAPASSTVALPGD